MTSERGVVWLLTGESGSGKTPQCGRLVACAHAAGLDVAGVLSPGRFFAGEKTAIDAVDLRMGGRHALAVRREGDVVDGPQTRRWAFDRATLAWGELLLQAAVPCDVLVVDELGPLEFEGRGGWPAGLSAVDSGDYQLAVVSVRPGCLERARRRWPAARTLAAARGSLIEGDIRKRVPGRRALGAEARQWEARHRRRLARPAGPPAVLLQEHARELPSSGLAIDVAMGLGRNSAFLLARGLEVVGVDRSAVAVAHVQRKQPRLRAVLADAAQLSLPAEAFDLIVNVNYLERALWPHYMRALRPGGVLVFETFSQEMAALNPEMRPQHLLQPDELLVAFAGLDVRVHRQGWQRALGAAPQALESLIARKPGRR